VNVLIDHMSAPCLLLFSCPLPFVLNHGKLRKLLSEDIIGVQLGGALKNPLAIGAGMVEGHGLGINTMAFYITRSQLELMALCRGMGGDRTLRALPPCPAREL